MHLTIASGPQSNNSSFVIQGAFEAAIKTKTVTNLVLSYFDTPCKGRFLFKRLRRANQLPQKSFP